ncbi:MAG: tetratricopeptide repeat protein [Leptolyngbya sp. SIO4C1]|nr:tetratricopeptide repeat protein [Leptolyngbya sp. SIO4C1]
MRDRYLELIDQIVAATLQGKIRAKAQVYDWLQAEIEPGTGEIFERCLQTRADDIQPQLDQGDELQQAKALRQQRALKTIQSEWSHWQKENQASAALQQVVDAIAQADTADRLAPLLAALDPNQADVLTREQLQQLAKQLEQRADQVADSATLLDFAAGLTQGLQIWQRLDTHVVSWIYDQARGSIGFGKATESRGPWASWAKQVNSPELQRLFQDLADHQTVTEAGLPAPMSVQSWLTLAVVLQRLQLGLVVWFDKQPYDPTAGKRLSIATFLTFSVVWSQLSQRFQALQQSTLADGCFQIILQILRQFAQQPYFPLYGGLFAALSGEPLQSLLDYLNQPLRQVPNTATKARILTLLGFSQRALGRYQQAVNFHREALAIAQAADDRPCQIANLNHWSRTSVRQKDYAAAIDTSQRALILARQSGDRLGEANALANLGYSEVFLAQQENALDSDRYEQVLGYLQRGLSLSEQLGDLPSQAMCAHSLGLAQVILAQHEAAVETLRKALYIAQNIGDLFLQGVNYAYLAEAYRSLDNTEKAIATGCLGMYLLHQIGSDQWRQPAAGLSILYGQLGPAAFQTVVEQFRPQLLLQIGVDGYDYLPKLLTAYRQSLT